MDIEIRMPDLATTADTITISRWLVEVGMSIQLGEPLLEIETDKAAMDVEAVAAGTLKAVYANAGDQVTVGQVIAVIDGMESRQLPIEAAEPAQLIPEAPILSQGSPPSKISMFARNRLARQAVAENGVSLTVTQREVAHRLQASKQTIPHFYLNTSANAERIITLRESARNQTPPQKVLWDAFFVIAVARALQQFNRMRYQFEGERLVQREIEAIGVAADIDDVLYVVPIEKPLTMSAEQISAHILERVERIRQGDIAAKKLTPTAITVTNLGAENIESFMAIINPPEAAILAIGKIAPSVQAQGDQIVIQQRVALSLSVDHRIANGTYAARFLGRIVNEIEAW